MVIRTLPILHLSLCGNEYNAWNTRCCAYRLKDILDDVWPSIRNQRLVDYGVDVLFSNVDNSAINFEYHLS